MKKEEIYSKLLATMKDDCGEKESFKTLLGDVLFDDLCRVGYIKEGIDGRLLDRCQITTFGRSQMQSYVSLCKGLAI